MSPSEPPPPRLAPARPEAYDADSAGYMPRLPWRWILLGVMSVSTVAFGYWLKQERKATELRSQILRVHEDELAEPARRYREFREKLEAWVLAAGEGEPAPYVDRRLRIGGLRSGKGLYLRLSAADTKDADAIEKGAREMTGDVILSCLGIAAASARGLWEKGAFLMPEWTDDARESGSVMGLRVTDEMLARHIRADLPTLLNLIRSDWFLLVIQRGDNRRDHPVDVFLWDIRSEQKLLSARIQATGVLLPVRLRVKGAPASPGLDPERLTGAGATDCSIAAQLKKLAGGQLLEVDHVEPPTLDATVDAGVDAG